MARDIILIILLYDPADGIRMKVEYLFLLGEKPQSPRKICKQVAACLRVGQQQQVGKVGHACSNNVCRTMPFNKSVHGGFVWQTTDFIRQLAAFQSAHRAEKFPQTSKYQQEEERRNIGECGDEEILKHHHQGNQAQPYTEHDHVDVSGIQSVYPQDRQQHQ